MAKQKILLLVAATLCVGLLHAQYSLYFVQNGEFDTTIGPWYTCLQNSADVQIQPGTAEWSADHGGSAHLVVSGAPSFVSLAQCIGTFLCPGDTITAHITQTDLGNFGATHICLGGDGAPFCQQADAPTPAGEYDLSLVSDRFYMPGTELMIMLVVWPGSGETWVHYVRLGRGGQFGPSGPSAFGDRPPTPGGHAASVRPMAYPVPTRGGLAFSFDLLSAAPVKVRIYNAAGSLVRELVTAGGKGHNLVRWDGLDRTSKKVAAGAYYYKLSAADGYSGDGKIVVAE